MTKAKALLLIRKAELRDFRDYVEDRVQPYTRYVVDQDFLIRHGLLDHPRLDGGRAHA